MPAPGRGLAGAAGILLLIGALPLSGQAPPPPDQGPPATTPGQPTFRTGVGLVRVDVTVTGNRGQPVTDLTAADFVVEEDGRPQQIQTLQYVRVTGHPAPDDDLSLEIRSPEHAAQEAARDDVRLLVIFLDDYHLRHGPLFDVRLREMLRRFVEAEMKPTDLFGVMGPLTPMTDLGLTRARQDIVDRIQRFQGRLGGFVPPRSVLEEGQYYLSPGQAGRVRTEVTFGALEALVEYLGALREGRKSVLFVSEGPPLRPGGSSQHDRLAKVITAANRANVTIHTLDPRELASREWTSASNEALAGDTGGRALARSNDFTRGLRSVMADASTYYLLGYVPDRVPHDGKFHRISVRVARKGLRVLARKGYWAPTLDERRPPAPLPAAPAEVTSALGTLAEPRRGRLVDWWIGTERRTGGSMGVTVSWERGSGELASSAEAVKVTVLDSGAEHVAAAGPDRTAAGPWRVTTVLPSQPHRLRLTVLNAAGEPLQTWNHDVAPRAGLAFDTARILEATSAAAFRTLGTGDPAPSVRRRFRRTDRVALVTAVHGAHGGVPSVEAELLNKHGARLMTLPRRQLEGGGIRVDLPLTSLAHAEYVVRLTAREADTAVSETVAFAVVP